MRFHTNLPVTDIKATVDFYRHLFGEEPVKLKDDYAKFLPANGGLNISFHVPGRGVSALQDLHLGFELPDQASLDAVHRRLTDSGILADERGTEICCYAKQDKFRVTDPNGYEWELYHLLEDTELKIEATTNCCPPKDVGVPSAEGDSTGCC